MTVDEKQIKKFLDGEITECPLCETKFEGGTIYQEINERVKDLTSLIYALFKKEIQALDSKTEKS